MAAKAKVIELRKDGTVSKSRSNVGWKFAVKELLSLKPKPGHFISREWLHEQFGIYEPTSWTRDEWLQYNFKFLANMEKFRDELLEVHNIDLVKVRNKRGWVVLHPKDQTRNALEEGLREIANSLTRTTKRILYVDTAALTPKQKQENLEALNKIEIMRATFTKHRRLSHSCYQLLQKKLNKAGIKSIGGGSK